MTSIVHARQTRSRGSATGAAPTAPTRLTRRFAWGVAVVGLGLALVLGGCGAGAAQHNNGAAVSGQPTTTTGASVGASTPATTGSSSAAQQAQSLDQQTQNAISSLDNAQNDANTDYSSQDTPQQP